MNRNYERKRSREESNKEDKTDEDDHKNKKLKQSTSNSAFREGEDKNIFNVLPEEEPQNIILDFKNGKDEDDCRKELIVKNFTKHKLVVSFFSCSNNFKVDQEIYEIDGVDSSTPNDFRKVSVFIEFIPSEFTSNEGNMDRSVKKKMIMEIEFKNSEIPNRMSNINLIVKIEQNEDDMNIGFENENPPKRRKVMNKEPLAQIHQEDHLRRVQEFLMFCFGNVRNYGDNSGLDVLEFENEDPGSDYSTIFDRLIMEISMKAKTEMSPLDGNISRTQGILKKLATKLSQLTMLRYDWKEALSHCEEDVSRFLLKYNVLDLMIAFSNTLSEKSRRNFLEMMCWNNQKPLPFSYCDIITNEVVIDWLSLVNLYIYGDFVLCFHTKDVKNKDFTNFIDEGDKWKMRTSFDSKRSSQRYVYQNLVEIQFITEENRAHLYHNIILIHGNFRESLGIIKKLIPLAAHVIIGVGEDCDGSDANLISEMTNNQLVNKIIAIFSDSVSKVDEISESMEFGARKENIWNGNLGETINSQTISSNPIFERPSNEYCRGLHSKLFDLCVQHCKNKNNIFLNALFEQMKRIAGHVSSINTDLQRKVSKNENIDDEIRTILDFKKTNFPLSELSAEINFLEWKSRSFQGDRYENVLLEIEEKKKMLLKSRETPMMKDYRMFLKMLFDGRIESKKNQSPQKVYVHRKMDLEEEETEGEDEDVVIIKKKKKENKNENKNNNNRKKNLKMIHKVNFLGVAERYFVNELMYMKHIIEFHQSKKTRDYYSFNVDEEEEEEEEEKEIEGEVCDEDEILSISTNDDDETVIMYYKIYDALEMSLDDHLSELVENVRCSKKVQKKKNRNRELAVFVFQTLMTEGYSCPFLNGDSRVIYSDLVSEAFEKARGIMKCFTALGIVGPQSSGKSLLLNIILGRRFPTHKAKCTKGIRMSMIRMRNNPERGMLVFDSQGTDSSSGGRFEDYGVGDDNSLLLFMRRICHGIIVNMSCASNAHYQKQLNIVEHNFKRLFSSPESSKLFVTFRMLKGLGDDRDPKKSMKNVLKKAGLKDNEISFFSFVENIDSKPFKKEAFRLYCSILRLSNSRIYSNEEANTRFSMYAKEAENLWFNIGLHANMWKGIDDMDEMIAEVLFQQAVSLIMKEKFHSEVLKEWRKCVFEFGKRVKSGEKFDYYGEGEDLKNRFKEEMEEIEEHIFQRISINIKDSPEHLISRIEGKLVSGRNRVKKDLEYSYRRIAHTIDESVDQRKNLEMVMKDLNELFRYENLVKISGEKNAEEKFDELIKTAGIMYKKELQDRQKSIDSVISEVIGSLVGHSMFEHNIGKGSVVEILRKKRKALKNLFESRNDFDENSVAKLFFGESLTNPNPNRRKTRSRTKKISKISEAQIIVDYVKKLSFGVLNFAKGQLSGLGQNIISTRRKDVVLRHDNNKELEEYYRITRTICTLMSDIFRESISNAITTDHDAREIIFRFLKPHFDDENTLQGMKDIFIACCIFSVAKSKFELEKRGFEKKVSDWTAEVEKKKRSSLSVFSTYKTNRERCGDFIVKFYLEILHHNLDQACENICLRLESHSFPSYEMTKEFRDVLKRRDYDFFFEYLSEVKKNKMKGVEKVMGKMFAERIWNPLKYDIVLEETLKMNDKNKKQLKSLQERFHQWKHEINNLLFKDKTVPIVDSKNAINEVFHSLIRFFTLGNDGFEDPSSEFEKRIVRELRNKYGFAEPYLSDYGVCVHFLKSKNDGRKKKKKDDIDNDKDEGSVKEALSSLISDLGSIFDGLKFSREKEFEEEHIRKMEAIGPKKCEETLHCLHYCPFCYQKCDNPEPLPHRHRCGSLAIDTTKESTLFLHLPIALGGWRNKSTQIPITDGCCSKKGKNFTYSKGGKNDQRFHSRPEFLKIYYPDWDYQSTDINETPEVIKDFVIKKRDNLSELFHYKNEFNEEWIDLYESKIEKSILDRYVGWKNLKKILLRIEDRKRSYKERTGFLNFTLWGAPGVGKTTAGEMIKNVLFQLGLIKRNYFRSVSRQDFMGRYQGQPETLAKKTVEDAKGGVLMIDEAYALLEKSRTGESSGRRVLDVLCDELDRKKKDLVVVFAGYQAPLQKLFDYNVGLERRFPHEYRVTLDPFSCNELAQILIKKLEKRRYKISEDVSLSDISKAIRLRYTSVVRNTQNGGLIDGLCDTVVGKCGKRTNFNDNTVVLEDIESEVVIMQREELEEILSRIVGRAEVKERIRSYFSRFEGVRRKEKDENKMNDEMVEFSLGHIMIIGNPGTGKTEFGKIFGRILGGLGFFEKTKEMKVVKSSSVMDYKERDFRKLFSEHDGGVLFLDEAGQLANLPNFNELMGCMDEFRSRVVVIFAGYLHQMKKLMEKDIGLFRRFGDLILLEDYKIEEIEEILVKMLIEKEHGSRFGGGARKMISVRMANKKLGNYIKYMNGGMASRLADTISNSQKERIGENKSSNKNDGGNEFRSVDIQRGFDKFEDSLDVFKRLGVISQTKESDLNKFAGDYVHDNNNKRTKTTKESLDISEFRKKINQNMKKWNKKFPKKKKSDERISDFLMREKAMKRVYKQTKESERIKLLRKLRKRNLKLSPTQVPGDGVSCQFESLMDQFERLGIDVTVVELRRQVSSYLRPREKTKNRCGVCLGEFLPLDKYGSWSAFCSSIGNNEWGNELSLLAIAEIYQIQINVISSIGNKDVIVRPLSTSPSRIVWIGHFHEFHYVSVIGRNEE